MTKEKMIKFIVSKSISDSGDRVPDGFILEWISNISFQPASVGSRNFIINIWLFKVSGAPNKKTFRLKVSSFDFCNKFNNDLNNLMYVDDYDDDVLPLIGSEPTVTPPVVDDTPMTVDYVPPSLLGSDFSCLDGPFCKCAKCKAKREEV